MIFTSPMNLMFAGAIVLAIGIIVAIRRLAISRMVRLLGLVGLICIALSAGGISWRRNAKLRIAVTVDCSPSTRGASFRDRTQLQARLRELLGNREFEFYTFADQTRPAAITDPLAEISTEQTRFTPPPADAIVLFSDGRFDLPTTAPRVFAVIDPLLDQPVDAAVRTLEQRGDSVATEVGNAGPARTLNWGEASRSPTTVPSGDTVLMSEPVVSGASITARLSPGDLWPENDALSIQLSPPMASQRWWIGDGAPAGWTAISPTNLPADAAAWLSPAIVVLNNISADALPPPQMDRLQQYVRDLGGALLVVGGDHAFSAGGYPGTAMESLSPLASSPPEPVMHWILLADSSGSMAAPAKSQPGDRTRFAIAADAIVQAARSLPGDDLLSIGSFAREVRWWSVGKAVKQTFSLPLPPADVSPGGPTNLEAALKQVAASLPDSLPAELLLLTDAQATFADPAGIAALLRQHHIRLDVLAIGDASANSALAQIAKQTGGQQMQQIDPTAWAATTKQLLHAALPDRLVRGSIGVTFQDDLAALASRNISLADRTWLKESTIELASGKNNTDTFPLAARWHVGEGDVIATAFAPISDEVEAIAQLIARRPRDPRFSVQWQSGSKLHVRIDAQDRGQQMNGVSLSIQLAQAQPIVIPQTAPGRYEINLPSPRTPQFVTIRQEAEVLDRFAVAERYPAEFDSIGNDDAALSELAKRTGGEVIDPSEHREIAFRQPQTVASMASLMAAIGAAFMGVALLWWNKKG